MRLVDRVVKMGLVAATGLLINAGAVPSAERYDIDTSHSHVGFTVRHLAVASVKDRFTRFNGHVLVNESDVTKSSVHVTIDAGSIDTGHERRDNHLRSGDIPDVEVFPNITFATTRVERTADGLLAIGDLRIRDVTREVSVQFQLAGPVTTQSGRRRLGAEGTLNLNRFDFGLQWNRIQEAVQVVGDEVRIELNIEANTPRQG